MEGEGGILPRPPLPEIWRDVPPGPVLVVAPHADDEVCGCGGALALHGRRGDPVHLEILTSGETGDPEGRFRPIREVREAEAKRAAAVLGIGEVRFWGLPDNFEITRGDVEAAAERIEARAREIGAAVLYHPWEGEAHGDHHGAALACGKALERLGPGILGLGYEVWSPLPASVILDITPVLEVKRMALEAYVSQLFYTDYLHHILGLNAHRGVFLEGRARWGEAFRVTRSPGGGPS